jgi:hypothetical protein
MSKDEATKGWMDGSQKNNLLNSSLASQQRILTCPDATHIAPFKTKYKIANMYRFLIKIGVSSEMKTPVLFLIRS